MTPSYSVVLFLVFLLTGISIAIYYFGNLLDYMVERGGGRGLQIGSWKTHLLVGRPEIKKVEKAAIARIGLGANDSEETIYWNAFTDENGDQLSSDHNYQILFCKEPEVDYKNFGFWSLTVYGSNKFFVVNNEKRYSINSITSRDINPIILSNIEPKNNERWLPLPEKSETISLSLRCYLPYANMKKGEIEVSDLPVIRRL